MEESLSGDSKVASRPMPTQCGVFTVLGHRQRPRKRPSTFTSRKLDANGHSVQINEVVPSGSESIKRVVEQTETALDIVVLCGETSLVGGRDDTHDSFSQLQSMMEEIFQGFAEALRRKGEQKVESEAAYWQALAGMRKGTLFFWIPRRIEAAKIAVDHLILPEISTLVKGARSQAGGDRTLNTQV